MALDNRFTLLYRHQHVTALDYLFTRLHA